MRIKPQRTLLVLATVLILLVTIFSLGQVGSLAQGMPLAGLSNEVLIGRLHEQSGGNVRIYYHAETGRVRFIGTTLDKVIAQPSDLGANASPEEAARAFLSIYGKLFGLKEANTELAAMKVRMLDDGRAFVRFQQTYRGIPVVGGELIVQVAPGQAIVSANGEILPQLELDVTPKISAQTARQIALAKVAKDYGLSMEGLAASEPELWVYNPILLGGPGPRFTALVWRTEVTPLELAPINEFVLVDAQLGAIALHFSQIDTALNNRTYDANNTTTLPGTIVCNKSNPTCSGGDAHAVAAHIFAADTYNFFKVEHGRDSIDDAGMTLTSTVHYDVGYRNAFWNGSQMVYGDGYGWPLADDVVAHELTHGVTQFESSLFYFYQSGAINESLSDVWGEFVDQTNGAGTDRRSVRWLIGEDVSGLGAFRSMKNPTLFGQPDRMTSASYFCEQTAQHLPEMGDSGGVHYNSGVNNKAVYLMTDGATFNGYTVAGLGYAKVADLYNEVQNNLLTSASDYADLYALLIQASLNLGFSPATQQAIQAALDAVEMDQQPTTCQAPEAPVCDTGSPDILFFDDIESGSGNWVAGANSGTPVWFVPMTVAGWGPYATSGEGNIWGPNQGAPLGGTSDAFLAMKGDVALPADAYFYFSHAFGFESESDLSARYDGGLLEYSTNGGSSWSDAGSLFDYNGYNGTLESSNPLGAVPAFSADSRGYIASRLDLSSLAGQNVRFRFRIGTDSDVFDYGWFIDDIVIYTCGTVGGSSTLFLPIMANNYDPSELLKNGGFETGAWTPWLTHTFPALDDQVYRSGVYSARLAGRNNVDSDYVLQEVTVPANATEVTIDFWYRVSSNDPTPADYLCVEIIDNTFSNVLVSVTCPILLSLEPQNQWINFKSVITGPELASIKGPPTVMVSFQGWTDTAKPGTAWVDDVSFKVTGTGP